MSAASFSKKNKVKSVISLFLIIWFPFLSFPASCLRSINHCLSFHCPFSTFLSHCCFSVVTSLPFLSYFFPSHFLTSSLWPLFHFVFLASSLVYFSLFCSYFSSPFLSFHRLLSYFLSFSLCYSFPSGLFTADPCV